MTACWAPSHGAGVLTLLGMDDAVGPAYLASPLVTHPQFSCMSPPFPNAQSPSS